MKRILCFGDSNTWGYIPGTATISRYEEGTRWTSILQRRLGEDWRVLEFGLCGCESGSTRRNKCYNANAQELFPSILFANVPVDVVFIMLGTNDLKTQNGWKHGDTAKNLDALISVTHTLAPKAAVLLATPVLLRAGIDSDPEFDRSAVNASRECAQEVAALAQKRRIPLFDTNALGLALGVDGCHFTADDHRTFGNALSEYIKTL